MAFVVEDGNGVLGATAYTTVAKYKSYYKDRGISVTQGSGALQSALIQATDYIDKRFGPRIRGQRANTSLASRSILTLTVQPLNDETITVGTVTYTFKTTLTIPAVETEAEIAGNLVLSLANLQTAMINSDNEDLIAVSSDDVSVMHIFTSRDGIVTTETLTNGSFDVAASIGFSTSRQPLEFPRQNLLDEDSGLEIVGVPTALEQATFEYARRSITAILLSDPTVDASGLKTTSTRNKVGPIETETRYSAETSAQITKPYPEADFLLAPFLISVGRLIRQ